jgi:lysozyme
VRTINQAGLQLIKNFEGLRLKVYLDAVGKPTIGYGHLIRPGESFTTITKEQAEALLVNDLMRTENGVAALIKIPINDNQYAALVSFAFNVGVANLKASTLLKKVNNADSAGAAKEWVKWCHAGGQMLPGLLRRREAELALFNTPVPTVDVSLSDIENQ